ncbi:hypothetical protein CA600_21945 [Paenibacillus sp. VTT E-133280]|uniref:hypothetical protein n=1 Tax=Paenibacillus sp. VTT E-133280 TaxID=1986222 RepID=UPI000BA035A9|nr:hypothetical protein [Paenibacillus sp. VTT E-133280]OZQ62563.1 hypothetical protein CA600_21945 [Paenibacillus sp. VTT E-133280]
MKKKWLLTGGAAGISGVIMLATGLTAFAGTSGYEDYKAALKNTAENMQSITVQADAILKDNGSVLSQAQGSLKANLANEAVSGAVKISGSQGSHVLSLYSQPDGQVWRSDASDIYYVKQDIKDKKDQESGTEPKEAVWLSSQEETIMDALIGNLKNEFTSTTDKDGAKHISLQLDNAQIPAVMQALAPVLFKNLSEEKDHESSKDTAVDSKDPEDLIQQNLFDFQAIDMTNGVQIQSIRLNADITPANALQHQQLDLTFVGQDEQGASHTLAASLDVQLSAFNATTTESIDLTGKQVQQVKEDHEHGHHD